MNKRIIILTILFLYANVCFAQDIVSELIGFKLRQYKESVKNEFGKPIQIKNFDDGFVAEIYLVKPDSSAYVIFEYPNWNNEIIYSIQLYGALESIDPSFKGIRMGISESELIKDIGKPSKLKELGDYGKMLEYENTNFSFEINLDGRLSSIKIIDIYDEIYPEPKVEEIPSFEKIKTILTSNNPRIISEILSPEMELYLNDKTLFFKQSWENEINSDSSKIYQVINEIIKGIDNIDTSNEKQYEENMRLTLGENPKHVLKFKTGMKLKEIVMKWENGKYVIWEIRT